MINFNGAAMAGDFSLLKLQTGSDTTSINPNLFFKMAALKGSFIKESAKDIQFSFSQADGKFEFLLSLIPKTKGIYMINFGPGRGTKSPCEKAGLEFIESNANKHLIYLQNTYYKGKSVPAADSLHLYFFKVY